MRCSDSETALHPGLCLGWVLWVFHAMSFSGSLSRSGSGVSFAFITGFVAETQAPPLLLGLRASLYQTNQRETIAMETVISCAGGQVLPGLLGLRIVSDASCSFLLQGVA